MAVAKLYPESQQGKRTSSKNGEVGVASSYVREARTVLRWRTEGELYLCSRNSAPPGGCTPNDA